ncbi:hypothetical protein SAMN04487970_101490 [Paenibacillus tianmuensis]|uniref:Uncharacterized protein n=1 Tax=Paenibacillus tianmuensis TaxID=624147 RepID=A0A1G4RDD6_9BACL|nr:hypothetical protein SAMN04487970_101490 [Paenibacillus tianmuensis]
MGKERENAAKTNGVSSSFLCPLGEFIGGGSVDIPSAVTVK